MRFEYVALLLLLVLAVSHAQETVVTVAGGFDDTGFKGVIKTPCGITRNPRGGYAIADRAAHRVRLLNAAGDVSSTLFGTAAGDVDGVVDVRVNEPWGIAYEGSSSTRDSYWLASHGSPNNVALKLIEYSTENEVRVISVGLPVGFAPTAVATSGLSDGTVWVVSDTSNLLVHASRTGVLTTTAVGSTNSQGVAVAGTVVYVADTARHVIYQYTGTGSPTVYCGLSNTVGTAVGACSSVARFSSPRGLTYDATNNRLFVADSGNFRVVVINLTTGVASVYAGAGIDGETVGPSTTARFHDLCSVYYDGSRVITGGVSVNNLGRVAAADPNVSDLISPVPSDGVALRSHFTNVWSLFSDPSGMILIGDGGSIRTFDPVTSQVTTLLGNRRINDGSAGRVTLSSAQCAWVTGIAGHPNGRTFYYADNKFNGTTNLYAIELNRARDFASGGVVFRLDPVFNDVRDIHLDVDNLVLYIVDAATRLVYRYYLDSGLVGVLAGNSTAPAAEADGVGPLATFAEPASVTYSKKTGFVYVADRLGKKVKRIDPRTATVTTAIGDGSDGNTNGFGPNARISSPTGVDATNDGLVYIVSNGGARIRVYDESTQEVSTAAGSVLGEKDGNLLQAQFNSPRVIAVDNSRGGRIGYIFGHVDLKLRRAVFDDICETLVCNDNNHCTSEQCVSSLAQCVFSNNTLPCNDNNPCTVGDTCNGSGVCVSGSISVGLPCFVGDLCIEGTACSAEGKCLGTPTVCNDENLCTIDTCNSAEGCIFTQINCDDSNPCTRDFCITNVGCVHEHDPEATCALDNDPCTLETCVALSNGGSNCTFQGLDTCNDNNPCTLDQCITGRGCDNILPTPCYGRNFVTDLECSCSCNAFEVELGCHAEFDPIQCLCLEPLTGPFIRVLVDYTSNARRRTVANLNQRDVFVRNQIADIISIQEDYLSIVQVGNNGVSGARRIVLDVYGYQTLSPADIIARMAVASDCGRIPPACVPTDISEFGLIDIVYVTILPSSPPDAGAVTPFPTNAPRPPAVRPETPASFLDEETPIPVVLYDPFTISAGTSIGVSSLMMVFAAFCMSVVLLMF